MNTLEKIISDKRISIEKFRKLNSIDKLKEDISSYKNYLNFKDKLMTEKISVIAEIKKASPSAGVIIENYKPDEIAKKYLKSGCDHLLKTNTAAILKDRSGLFLRLIIGVCNPILLNDNTAACLR